MAIEKDTRKATRKSKILKNKSKNRESDCLVVFPPARTKELWREEKGQLIDVGHNSWWHMKRAQHAAHNPKFDKMDLFRPVHKNTIHNDANSAIGSIFKTAILLISLSHCSIFKSLWPVMCRDNAIEISNLNRTLNRNRLRQTNATEIWITIQTFPHKKMHLRMSSAKRRPFVLASIS